MFKIKIVTQKLITSTKLIKNKFDGVVLFEKFEPKKRIFIDDGSNFSFVQGGTILGNGITITGSNRTVIGYNNNSGGYDISGVGNFVLLVNKKPNFFNRNMVKLIFGWKYVKNT